MKKVAWSLCALFVIIVSALVLPKINEKSPTDSPSESVGYPGALIIPYFDFAKTAREKFLDELVKTSKPNKVILLSANHFDSSADFLVTKRKWEFIDQKVETDNAAVQNLIDTKIATLDESVFENEQGINNVLPEVQKKFPSAKITPILVKKDVAKDKLESLVSYFATNCPDCFLVGSVNFSHDQPSSLAQIHDQTTIDALKSQDEERVLSSETDSPETLFILTRWGKLNKLNFSLYQNSNSGLVQQDYESGTTSWVIGEYKKDVVTEAAKTSFLFGGDIMFDRMVNRTMQKLGYDKAFASLGETTFYGADIRIANLEGPISGEKVDDDVTPDNLTFDFPIDSLKASEYLNFSFLSLSNNHSQNAGLDGLTNTREILTDSKITPIGSQSSFDETNIARFDSAGIKVSIIAVNILSLDNHSELISAAKKEKEQGRYVIFFPHWGNEYNTTHSVAQEQLAYQMIDNGADLIIGSHPHVIQDSEIYKNKLIVYSLGNFIFDQTFSKETQRGVLVGGVIDKDALTVSFFPIEIKNYQPKLLRGQERSDILKHVVPSGTELRNGDTILLKSN